MAREEFAFTSLAWIMAYAKRWHADDADLGRFAQIFHFQLCVFSVVTFLKMSEKKRIVWN
jgi:hypothetical protein